VKAALLFLGLAVFVAVIKGSELNRESVFDSIDESVTAVKAFQPAVSKGRLAEVFTISERDDDARRTSVTATAIETCDAIWSDRRYALLFATASPRTVATDSHIGVLFLLVRQRDGWRIADLLRFTALGKDSGLSAKLTALAGSGRELGNDGFAPVVTINESQGGRGYSYETSASYALTGSKLKRLELK
jgi:hypothetical protein